MDTNRLEAFSDGVFAICASQQRSKSKCHPKRRSGRNFSISGPPTLPTVES
ncbi:hypothetical protein QUA03_02920 [Microcoleus sp. S36b_A4]|uniref:hypothetical protein n=1 Tax=Microcoleus sp. S36b_A4 TaxID=3055420 RepID=UPI002FD214A7